MVDFYICSTGKSLISYMHLLSEGEEDIEKILRDLAEKEKQKTGSMPMKLLSVSYLYTLTICVSLFPFTNNQPSPSRWLLIRPQPEATAPSPCFLAETLFCSAVCGSINQSLCYVLHTYALSLLVYLNTARTIAVLWCSGRVYIDIDLIFDVKSIDNTGEFCDGQGTQVYNDLFRWNIDKNEWKKIESPNTPPPRCSHQVILEYLVLVN
jgi:hypothetical protein